MREGSILAIDLGTSGAKAAVVDPDGSLAGRGWAPVPTYHGSEGAAEQDPGEVWQAVIDACRAALTASGGADRVTAVAPSAQYSSIVPVDADGRPLMNLITWMDRRGSKQAMSEYGGFGDHSLRQLRWVRIHGIPPLDSGVDSLAHMRWIMRARPEVYEQTTDFLEPVDFVVARLTGRVATNQCSSFMMLVTDNRHPDQTEYSPRLVQYSGIDPDKLPDLVDVGEVVGTVRVEVAEQLGLSSGVGVLAGLNDTQAGGLAAGAINRTHAGVSMGTTCVMITDVGFKRTDIKNSLVSMPSPVPGDYFVMAEGGVGGRAIDHFLEDVVFATDEFGDHNRSDKFTALLAALHRVPPGSEGVLFLPWLTGSMSPAEDGTVRGGFLNLSLATTRQHLGRAVLEGVAHNLRWLLSAVESFAGRRVPDLRFYGGGALSEPWAQIIADITDRPTHQLADPSYAVCRGAGIYGLVNTGQMSYPDAVGLSPVRNVFEPNPALARLYADMHEQFVEAFHANRKIFRALNR